MQVDNFLHINNLQYTNWWIVSGIIFMLTKPLIKTYPNFSIKLGQ